MGKKLKQWHILFSWAPKSLWIVSAATKFKKTFAHWKKSYDKFGIFKSRNIVLLRKLKAMVFPAAMYGCESWTIKKAECQRIDAFELWCWMEKTLMSPLDSKEIKPVNPKGNQPWIFNRRTDAEGEVPKLWPTDAKSQRIGRDPEARKDWRQNEKEAEVGQITSLT